MSSLSNAQPSLTARRAYPTWLTPLAALAALVVATIVLELVDSGSSSFIKPENILNILQQNTAIGIIALGMTIVIISGGIDLSVGSLLALAGGWGLMALNAVLKAGGSESLALTAAVGTSLLVGLGAGLLNGLLITWGRIAPFIATLGGLAAFRSLAKLEAEGGEFRSASAGLFSWMGTRGIPIPWTNLAPPGMKPVPLVFPASVIVFILLAVATHLILTRLRIGRYIYAIGCNEKAARYSAINVTRVKLFVYSLIGLLTGASAFLSASRMNSVSSSDAGKLYELDAIAAVVIGGSSITGGRGTIIGTVIGVLILGVIANMLNLLNVSPYLQDLCKGAIIIAAVLMQRGRARA